jgi:hypothetical protein
MSIQTISLWEERMHGKSPLLLISRIMTIHLLPVIIIRPDGLSMVFDGTCSLNNGWENKKE